MREVREDAEADRPAWGWWVRRAVSLPWSPSTLCKDPGDKLPYRMGRVLLSWEIVSHSAIVFLARCLTRQAAGKCDYRVYEWMEEGEREVRRAAYQLGACSVCLHGQYSLDAWTLWFIILFNFHLYPIKTKGKVVSPDPVSSHP